MTLLVTGATGHVGGAIVRLAVARGLDVVALHRGAVPAPQPRVTWTRCDLADPASVRILAATHRIERCIHAAAISNEAYAKPDPLGAIATNVGATATLLEAARAHGWRRFVHVGTGSVFQRRADKTAPIDEDQPPEVTNVYGTTKLGAELATRMYRAEYGVSAATVRISWVYGPPVISDQATRGPIPSYLLRALRGQPIREGGADFAASFTYVDDAAAGLLSAVTAPTLSSDTYHLGHGVNFTAAQAADAVRAAVPNAVIALTGGTEPWTRYTGLRGPLAGERLRVDTGWTPGFSLEAGVRAYADWMRAHPEQWRACIG